MRWFCSAIVFFLVAPLQAQNLVVNPGFEMYGPCPETLGNLQSDLDYWEAPTDGSTDYFNRCSNQMGVPENYNGVQPAKEGKGYAGFYAFAPGDYREYLMGRLRRPLLPGGQYEVTVYLSLSERSDYALREFGMLLCSRPLRVATKKQLSRKYWFADPENQHQYLSLGDGSFAADTGGWMRFTTSFTAKGGEQYLILGNFEGNAQTRTQLTGRKSNRGAYYYVDEVELAPVGASAQLAASDTRFPLDSLMLLPELTFEFDTYSLTGTGRELLDSLYLFLKGSETNGLHLELSGHTDSRGRPEYNRLLSERRCRAVSEYLTGLGLEAERVRWKGYGDSRPVAPNTNPDGRARNRRVEFAIRAESVPDPQLN